MDIVEFLAALRRQRLFLGLGMVALIVLVVAANYRVEDLSFDSRIEPKYTASIQMAVVPDGVTSLADPAIAANYDGPASFYSQLLQTPQAAFDIQVAQDARFTEPISVAGVSRTGILNVTVTATTPAGAERAALGAFRWLEGKLADEPLVAALPELEDDGLEVEANATAVLLDVDPAYAAIEDQLWLVIETPSGDGFSIPVAEAPLLSRPYSLLLEEPRRLTVSLEDSTGEVIGSGQYDLPALETGDRGLPPVALAVQPGAIGLPDAELGTGFSFSPARVEVGWDLTSIIGGEDEPRGPTRLTVMLLNDVPIVSEIGLRRQPILLGGPIIGGALVLLVVATLFDRYRQVTRRERTRAAAGPEIVDYPPERSVSNVR